MITQEFLITFAAYLAIMALLTAAVFQNFDKISLSAKTTLEKRSAELQCIEQTFLKAAGENTMLDLNNSCSFYGGIYTGERNAA